MQNEYNFQPKQNKPLTGKQKTVAVVLVLSSLVVLFLGFSQLGKSVKAPFEVEPVKDQEEDVFVDDETTALRNKDSDQDGINDYDETYIYQTNPYNEDSDSDGVSDKKEIDSGDNPNCPVGENCGIASEFTEEPDQQPLKAKDSPTSINDIINNIDASGIDLGNLGLDGTKSSTDISNLQKNIPDLSNEQLKEVLPAEMSATDIREMLKMTGMTDEILNQFSDEQLIQTYQATLDNLKSQ